MRRKLSIYLWKIVWIINHCNLYLYNKQTCRVHHIYLWGFMRVQCMFCDRCDYDDEQRLCAGTMKTRRHCINVKSHRDMILFAVRRHTHSESSHDRNLNGTTVNWQFCCTGMSLNSPANAEQDKVYVWWTLMLLRIALILKWITNAQCSVCLLGRRKARQDQKVCAVLFSPMRPSWEIFLFFGFETFNFNCLASISYALCHHNPQRGKIKWTVYHFLAFLDVPVYLVLARHSAQTHTTPKPIQILKQMEWECSWTLRL